MVSLPNKFESAMNSARTQSVQRAMSFEPTSMSSASMGRSRSLSIRSLSISSIASSVDTSGIDMEDLDMMDCLVQDVQRLSEALGQLSSMIEQCSVQKSEAAAQDQPHCVRVHDALNHVSRALRDLLRYQFLRSTEVLTPASNLVHRIKELKLDVPETDRSHQEAQESIKTLESALADRLRTYLVGDYLSWEMSQDEIACLKLSQSTDDLSSINTNMSSNHEPAVRRQMRNKSIQRRHSTFAKSKGVGYEVASECDSDFENVELEWPPELEMTADQMDRALLRLNSGVDLAFDRAKQWSKYCKDILNFAQRRISVETEHAKAVEKLSEGTRLLVQEHGDFLPLKDIFFESFKLESEFYKNCTDAMKRLYEFKFIKPLENRRSEHEAKRKGLRAHWDKYNKQVQDTALELKKAKHNYASRDLAYKKARETSLKTELASTSDRDRTKVEKRRKLEEDAMIRREQAANECQELEQRLDQKYKELERVKATVIRELRELIYQCDQTTKACTVSYFQAFSGLWALLPMQYQHLSDSAKAYTPGMEYMSYVQSLTSASTVQSSWKNRAASDDDLSLLPKFRTARPMIGGGVKSTPSFASASSQPSFFDPDDDDAGSSYSEICIKTNKPDLSRAISDSSCSESALSHSLQKLRLPAKCGHCDSYTFFQTVQCGECGMTWHKNCLTRVDVRCGPGAKTMGQTSRRMSVFGVPLQTNLVDSDRQVPLILERCIQELDKRGAQMKGIYRVSGVKSKIEQICENFERCNDNLQNVHPTNIASVVKLYLRQLPEPLLTFGLYPDFIQFAKEFPSDHDESFSKDVQDQKFVHSMKVKKLRSILERLPTQNYHTLQFVILHLRRMTWFASQNQMNATNMGIVFGPTLLWKEENDPTLLTGLLEAPSQARVVEMLIRLVYDVFDVTEPEEKLRYRDLYEESELLVEQEEGPSRPRKATDESGDSSLGDDERPLPEKNRKSATPDLLKLPPHKKISNTSSENGALLGLEGQSLSDDEETTSTDLQFSVSPGALSGFDTSDSDRLICGSVAARPTSSKFERGRPIRGGRNPTRKQRSYTTSILVSPSLKKKIILPTRGTSFEVSDAPQSAPVVQDPVTVSPTKGQLFLKLNPDARVQTDSDLDLDSRQQRTSTRLESEKTYLEPVGLLFSGSPEEISYV